MKNLPSRRNEFIGCKDDVGCVWIGSVINSERKECNLMANLKEWVRGEQTNQRDQYFENSNFLVGVSYHSHTELVATINHLERERRMLPPHSAVEEVDQLISLLTLLDNFY